MMCCVVSTPISFFMYYSFSVLPALYEPASHWAKPQPPFPQPSGLLWSSWLWIQLQPHVWILLLTDQQHVSLSLKSHDLYKINCGNNLENVVQNVFYNC